MVPWLGAAISIPTSTLLFWCLAPFFVDPTAGNLKAVILFACVGLFFPGTVALLNFESNRLMGPNIAGTLISITPVFAVLLATVILGERVRGPQLLALAGIVVGITLMYRGQVSFVRPINLVAGATSGGGRHSWGHPANRQIRL
jgi:drug/metabolite transporter (DMT)-like permease